MGPVPTMGWILLVSSVVACLLENECRFLSFAEEIGVWSCE